MIHSAEAPGVEDDSSAGVFIFLFSKRLVDGVFGVKRELSVCLINPHPLNESERETNARSPGC